jgi:GT2 family glycosyltransferase
MSLRPAARISAVIPTRNRAQDAEACVRSILTNPEDDFELLVVDQSDTDATMVALKAFEGDPRFRYLRSNMRGASQSRNVGINATVAPIIAFTDDDCRVRADWIARVTEVFAADADAAVLFGRVTVADNVDGRVRYAAQFEPSTREHRNRLPTADEPLGLSANMAIRRSVLDRVGAFDPFLGAGAKFPAAEEYDLTIRILAAGMKVLNVPEVCVLHVGVREGKEASALMGGYGIGIGAALAKHARLGTKGGTALLASWIALHGGTAVLNVVTGRRPTNLRFVGSLLLGMARSSRQPIDATRFIYAPR